MRQPRCSSPITNHPSWVPMERPTRLFPKESGRCGKRFRTSLLIDCGVSLEEWSPLIAVRAWHNDPIHGAFAPVGGGRHRAELWKTSRGCGWESGYAGTTTLIVSNSSANIHTLRIDMV